MIALLSDLHANLEALEAVLADLESQNVSSMLCLGDVIGYGASPAEVIRLTKERMDCTLQGNHDAALLDDRAAFGFHERALDAIDWTRKQIDPARKDFWPLWDWLGELKPSASYSSEAYEDICIVHASPREPLTEYLLPNLPASSERVLANFKQAKHRLTFYGHTHHPGCFTEGEAFQKPTQESESVFRLDLSPDQPYLINVGSVGQPRDRDPRACYALFDGETVRWRRVAYDNESAARRILAAGLPESLAQRLIVGR